MSINKTNYLLLWEQIFASHLEWFAVQVFIRSEWFWLNWRCAIWTGSWVHLLMKHVRLRQKLCTWLNWCRGNNETTSLIVLASQLNYPNRQGRNTAYQRAPHLDCMLHTVLMQYALTFPLSTIQSLYCQFTNNKLSRLTGVNYNGKINSGFIILTNEHFTT